MNCRPSIFFFLTALLTLAPFTSAVNSEPGSELTVYLITMGPGQAIYEKFGHNAIWIRDTSAQTDIAYNYGLFDFGGDFFIRFIEGKMRYSMRGFDALGTLDYYLQEDRSLWVQELNLSPSQRLALRDFLRWNELPQNRYYHYDYYKDNCSTRIRDALDRILVGQIRRQTESVPTATTYRWHTRRIMAENPPLYTALEYVLGQPIDLPISAWDEMFLPLQLRDHLNRITISTPAGTPIPLVRAQRTLHESARYPVRTTPPHWTLHYFAIGLAIASLFLLLGLRQSRRLVRILFWSLLYLWTFLVGGAGIFLIGAWVLTDHWAVYYNENLLQFSPAAFLLLFFYPALIRRRTGSLAIPRNLIILVAASSLLGLFLKLFPPFIQSNYDIIALLLPVHLTLAVIFLTFKSSMVSSKNTPSPKKK